MTTQLDVLIVEDSDDDYEATLRAFKKSSFHERKIARCEDGHQALDYLYQRGNYADPDSAPRPSLILLDLNMPGLDGRAVLGELKSDPGLRDIPVVVMTTSDNSKDIEDCYARGANTYLRKPLNLDELVDAVRHLNEYWFDTAILPGRGK